MDEIWLNTHTVLFRVYDDGPGYALPCVAIERIVWEWPDRAKLILYAPFPLANDLLEINNQVRFDLLYKECGPIEDYYQDEVIFQFFDCRIRRKWTPHAKSILQHDQGMIGVYVSLECKYRRGKWMRTKSS